MPHKKFGIIGWLPGGGGCREGVPQAIQMNELAKNGIFPDKILSVSVGAFNSLDIINSSVLWKNYINTPSAIYDFCPEAKELIKLLLKTIPHSPFHKHLTWRELGNDFVSQYKKAKTMLHFVIRCINSLPSITLEKNGSASESLSSLTEPLISLIQENKIDRIQNLLEFAPLLKILKQNIEWNSVMKHKDNLYFLVRSLETGKERILPAKHINSVEDLINMCCAASALRPLFPPVKIGEEFYCDGGHANPFPVEYLFGVGCDTVFAFVKDYYIFAPGRNIFEILLFEESGVAVRTAYFQKEKEAKARAIREGKNLFIIKPQQPLHGDLGILSVSSEAIEYTQKKETEAMQKFLEKILK